MGWQRGDLPHLRYKSIQEQDKSVNTRLSWLGRPVEYEGGGEETCSNLIAELNKRCSVEPERRWNDIGFKDGDDVWVEGAEKGRIKVKGW